MLVGRLLRVEQGEFEQRAGPAASDAHSGKLGVQIQLQRVRLALADGNRTQASRLLETLRSDAARLGEVPVRLQWLELEMASALRGGNRSDAAARYREALQLLKGIDHCANAVFLHQLGARAMAAGKPEAAAAASAAHDARLQLLAQAPADARTRLQEQLDRRWSEEAGSDPR